MAKLVEPKKVAVMGAGFKANGMWAAQGQYYFQLPVVSAVMVQEVVFNSAGVSIRVYTLFY